MRRDSFGNTPASRTLDVLLENYSSKISHNVGSKVSALTHGLSQLRPIKDKAFKEFMMTLYYKTKVNSIKNSKTIPEQLKSYVLNVISYHYNHYRKL